MAHWDRTLRTVDGEDIAGSWRHAFIRNGGAYYLTTLKVYADGIVDCWGLVTLDQFREKLRTGWVATTFEEGAQASAHEVASWTFADVRSWVSADQLYAEVVDEIETLNGRPDTSGRCLEALRAFLADQTEANRRLLEAAYEAVPEHRRHYLLGDMDAKDGPLRIVMTRPGKKIDGKVVTDGQRRRAIEYFAERRIGNKTWRQRIPAEAPSVVVPGSFHHSGWPDPPGVVTLHTQYPAPVTIGQVTYPTVEHAYWALRTTDPAVRAAVLAETNPYAVPRLAADAPSRGGWDASLHAVIAQLLRAKFQQHEHLAHELLATGEGRILFHASGFGDAYAFHSRRAVIGRLLEFVRSEQRAWRSGLLDLSQLHD
jgi:predicted NAD-dependent protein-ADP-ribosyltransferase YbiA (DUF1768 family)